VIGCGTDHQLQSVMMINTVHRGGQLSIHGNVVNVPADVNSVVNTLQKPINESQTIPIKLKSKLS